MGDYKVYALFSDVKSNVKYIDYTSKPITKRLGQHLENCHVGCTKYSISDIAEIAGLSRQTVSSIISTKLELNEG